MEPSYYQLKDFLKLHYSEQVQLEKESDIYIVKFTLDAQHSQILFHSHDLKEVIAFFKTKLFYNNAFLKIDDISCIQHFLKNEYNHSVKTHATDHKLYYQIFDETNTPISNSLSYVEFNYFVKSNYKYSLKELIPFICPKCQALLNVIKKDNATIYSCNQCGYKNLEIL